MRAKITALVCALVLMLTSLPAQAVQLREDNMQEAMSQLGVLNWSPVSKITKDAFVYSLAGFLYEDIKGKVTAEEAAISMGFIDESERYNGDERITTEEALKYAVILLGYGELGKAEGYTKIATQIGVSSGIALNKTLLQNEDGIKIIENLLETYPMVKSYNSKGEVVYTQQNRDTLLSMYRNIYEVQGIYSANDKTSIYGTGKAFTGMIKIDDTEYVYDGSDEALGSHVVAYVRQEKGEDGEIVYIGESGRNKYLDIDAADIKEISDDITKITYISGDEKFVKAKISNTPKVMYNGKFYGEYTKDDFAPDVGNLKLVDNDGDGYYDVVFITEYETMVVSSVDTGDMEFTNKYSYTGCLAQFKIEDEDEYVIYKDSEKVDISKIVEGDVLNIAASKGAYERLVTVYASSKTIEGVMKGRNEEENTFYVDDKEYKTSKAFRDYLSNENKAVNIGTEYVFYIDTFGNIAYFKDNSKLDYVLALRYREKDDAYQLIYMDLDGEWHESNFAKNVKINRTTRLSAEDAFAQLQLGWEPQIVVMDMNAAGEIKGIETAIETEAHNPERLTKYEKQMTYRVQTNSLNHSVYFEQGAKMIFFPKDVSYSKDDYYVKDASGQFKTDASYTLTIYDVDEYNFTPLMSMKGVNGSALKTNLFIVTKVLQVCDSDGEVHSQIVGNVGNFRNFVLESADATFVNANGDSVPVNPGDVLNLSVDKEGYVDQISKLYALNDAFTPSGSMGHNQSVIASGVIDAIDMEKMRARVVGDDTIFFQLTSSIPVQVYNPGDMTCELKTISSLYKGAKIVVQFAYGVPSSIILIDD